MTLSDAIAIARVTGYAQVSLADLERWQRWIARLQQDRDTARELAEEIREQADAMVKEATVCARQ